MTSTTVRQDVGRAFAEALGHKDFSAVKGLLDEQIDFRGLTPRRVWEASDPGTLVEDVFKHWFEESDDLEEILAIETDAFANSRRVAYRFRGHNPDGPFVVEQQAYYTEKDGRISWMRVLCSGFRAP